MGYPLDNEARMTRDKLRRATRHFDLALGLFDLGQFGEAAEHLGQTADLLREAQFDAGGFDLRLERA